LENWKNNRHTPQWTGRTREHREHG